MAGKRTLDAAGKPLRRRGRFSTPADRAAARKESKTSSDVVDKLHKRAVKVGAAHPAVDFLVFSRSVTDKKPRASWGACAGAASTLATVLRPLALRTVRWIPQVAHASSRTRSLRRSS
jgi:hypothetical protein